MSGSSPHPGDDELHSFLDGELDLHRRGAVAAFLRASPVDAERVEGWRRQQQIIRAAFAAVESEPAPPSMLLPQPARRRSCLRLLRPAAEPQAAGPRAPAQTPQRRGGEAAEAGLRRAWRPLSAAAIFAAGALAALAGAFLAGYVPARLPAASQAHGLPGDELFAARTVAALEAFKPQDSASAAAGAQEKARPAAGEASLIVPNLSGAGFALIGMRAAPAQQAAPGERMICLFYARGKEPAVALCIAPGEDGGRPGRFHIAPKTPAGAADAAISWRQAGAIYTLAGPLSELQLRELANRVRAEIDAFD